MICNHDFIRISDLEGAGHKYGATIGCAQCGQIRRLWADGEVEIVLTEGKVINKDEG